MRRLTDRLLVCVYMALAALPVLAMTAHIKDHRLEGSFPPAPPPKLAFGAVRSEAYQHQLTGWFEGSLGLRAWSIWMDNTLLYHAFGETKWGSHVQIGHGGMLFERDDITFFNKSDAMLPAPADVERLADDIAKLQALLRARGKALVPIFVPSKTTFYRASVPALWTRDLGDPRPSTQRIYQGLKHALEARRATFVDGIELLQTSPEPRDVLWGRDARHFSNYAGCLCVRATLERYAQLTATPPIEYPCNKAFAHAKRTHSDLDLFRLLNAWGVPRDPIGRDVDHAPYPERPAPHAPRVMWISSSFGWVMMGDAELSRRLPQLHIDYYNRTVFEPAAGASFEVKPFDESWNKVFPTRELYVLELNETYVTPGSAPGSFFGADAVASLLTAFERDRPSAPQSDSP
jgi:hypothetical protein